MEESKIMDLVAKYRDDGSGIFLGFMSGGADIVPLYYKEIDDDGVTNHVFYGLYVHGEEEDIEPISEEYLRCALLNPWDRNHVSFQSNSVSGQIVASYDSIVYDALEFYIVGIGLNYEDATLMLIENLFRVYGIAFDENYNNRW